MIRYGMLWCGMVWYGMVWHGMVWYGMERNGIVREWSALSAIDRQGTLLNSTDEYITVLPSSALTTHELF